MTKKEMITISELSEITGITPSSIRYYLNEGMLPEPLRKGKTKAYYNDDHIKILKKIKDLQIKKKLSIKEIKKIIPNYTLINNKQQTEDRKNDIIDAGIELFITKGYDAININDLVEKAGISKSTFYLHYESKESLLIDCAERIFADIDTGLNILISEKDLIKKFNMRTAFFISKGSHIIDMLNIIRGILETVLPENKQKLTAIISNMAEHLIEDINAGVKQGLFKVKNIEIAAYMLIGATEYSMEYLQGKSESEKKRWVENLENMFLYGAINNHNVR